MRVKAVYTILMDSGFILQRDSGFQKLDFGFQCPVFRIPRPKISWIPESGLLYIGRFLTASCLLQLTQVFCVDSLPIESVIPFSNSAVLFFAQFFDFVGTALSRDYFDHAAKVANWQLSRLITKKITRKLEAQIRTDVTFKGYQYSGEDNPNAQYKSRFNQMKYVIKITNEIRRSV